MNETMPRSEGSAGGSGSQVREKASMLARGVKEQARTQYDEKKNVAVGELGTLASQLRNVVDELSSSHPDNMTGRLISTLADRIESFGQSLEGKDLDVLVSDVERFARRNPAAFLGGAVAVGFLAARFLKSSASRGMSQAAWDADRMMSDSGDQMDSPLGSSDFSGGAVPTSGLYGSDADTPVGSMSPRGGMSSGTSRSSGISGTTGTGNPFDTTDDLSGGRK